MHDVPDTAPFPASEPYRGEPHAIGLDRPGHQPGDQPGDGMHLLVIEDEARMADYIVKALTEAGHRVDHANNGQTGLYMATHENYDALIVDRLLPQLDGLSVIGQLRAKGKQTPALILSALSAVHERVHGLRSGGDDYLVKPFAVQELLARLDIIVRRNVTSGLAAGTLLKVADLELDTPGWIARRGGVSIELKPQEFRLLEFLMRNAGRVVTRTMILESVWDYNFDPQTNVVDVLVSRLRAKVDREPAPPLIHTIRGAGYCLRAPG